MLAAVAQRLIQLEKIAVLTDLGEETERTLRYAASLARWYGSELMIVHACAPEMPVYLPPEPLPNWPADGPPLKQYAEEKLSALTEKLGMHDLAPKLVVREAGIKLLIEEVAEHHPNLLILATHGREGVRKWLLGSVTEGIFRAGQWPVLVLGPRFDSDRAARQIQLRTIVYATDLSKVSTSALQYAAGIARDHDAQLIALHVEHDPRRDFLFDRAMSLQKLQDWLKDRIDGLADALNGVKCAVEFGKPYAAIIQAAETNHADLLVLGARGLGAVSISASHFLGGTAYDVICSSPCPVLIVPQPR